MKNLYEQRNFSKEKSVEKHPVKVKKHEPVSINFNEGRFEVKVKVVNHDQDF